MLKYHFLSTLQIDTGENSEKSLNLKLAKDLKNFNRPKLAKLQLNMRLRDSRDRARRLIMTPTLGDTAHNGDETCSRRVFNLCRIEKTMLTNSVALWRCQRHPVCLLFSWHILRLTLKVFGNEEKLICGRSISNLCRSTFSYTNAKILICFSADVNFTYKSYTISCFQSLERGRWSLQHSPRGVSTSHGVGTQRDGEPQGSETIWSCSVNTHK